MGTFIGGFIMTFIGGFMFDLLSMTVYDMIWVDSLRFADFQLDLCGLYIYDFVWLLVGLHDFVHFGLLWMQIIEHNK